MTDNFVAWVAYSTAEQDRMRQALAAFSESDTRDELGIGVIRDAIADRLFPGTSTVQTRLRYFLIVPWVYQSLPKNRLTSRNIGAGVSGLEKRLIGVLANSGEDPEEGVFGASSGAALKRLPSSVYWNGLRRWGILNPKLELSQQALHDRWDAIRDAKNRYLPPDDAGIESSERELWYQLPPAPTGWPESLNLAVTRPEAEYLKGRMESCGGSLLAHLASIAPHGKAALDQGFAWDAIESRSLPGQLRELLDNAKRFSVLIHGTGMLYSLDLCEKFQFDEDLVREHRDGLQAWAQQLPRVFDDAWTPQALWSVLGKQAPLRRGEEGARKFVQDWFDTMRGLQPNGITVDEAARDIVRRREFQVKRARAHPRCHLTTESRSPRNRRRLHRLYRGVRERPGSQRVSFCLRQRSGTRPRSRSHRPRRLHRARMEPPARHGKRQLSAGVRPH